MERVLGLPDPHRVPGIRTAFPANHEIKVLRQQVDDLALAFVAPLEAADDAGWRWLDDGEPSIAGIRRFHRGIIKIKVLDG